MQGHAVLQAQRNGNGEAVHQGPEGRPLFMHIDKYFTQTTVLVFAGPQINLVASDHCLLGITLAPLRQFAPLGDNPLHHPFGHHPRLNPLRVQCRGQAIFGFLIGAHFVVQGGRQWLRQFRAVAI